MIPTRHQILAPVGVRRGHGVRFVVANPSHSVLGGGGVSPSPPTATMFVPRSFRQVWAQEDNFLKPIYALLHLPPPASLLKQGSPPRRRRAVEGALGLRGRMWATGVELCLMPIFVPPVLKFTDSQMTMAQQ